MKKLINYEILMSIITLGVFFVFFWLVGRYDGHAAAAVVAVVVVAIVGVAFVAANAGAAFGVAVVAVAVAAVAVIVVAIFSVAVVAANAGAAFAVVVAAVAVVTVAIAVGAAVVAVGTVGAVTAVVIGRNYARENSLAGKKVFASLTVEFMVILVPMLLTIF